jgi:hypothetical protein
MLPRPFVRSPRRSPARVPELALRRRERRVPFPGIDNSNPTPGVVPLDLCLSDTAIDGATTRRWASFAPCPWRPRVASRPPLHSEGFQGCVAVQHTLILSQEVWCFFNVSGSALKYTFPAEAINQMDCSAEYALSGRATGRSAADWLTARVAGASA